VTDLATDHGGGDPDRVDRSGYPDRGGVDVFDSLLVRQPIAGDPGAVRETVADWARENRDGDVRRLLPVEGVTLATIFFDPGGFGGAEGPGLVWYVEVVDDDAEPWTDPASAVRSSPLFAAGLDALVDDRWQVHAGDRDGHRHVTHATNPHRGDLSADRVGRSLVAPVAGDDLPVTVALTTLRLRPGRRARVVDAALGAVNRLKAVATRVDRVRRWLRDTTDTIEAETVYTESLLFDRRRGPAVYYYVEVEDIDQLYDAYGAADGWEVRLSDWVFRRFFEDAAEFLTPPLRSDCEVLVHAVDPERP
jgi:hypothetical protein